MGDSVGPSGEADDSSGDDSLAVGSSAAEVSAAGSSAPATATPGTPLGQCSPPYTLTEVGDGPQRIALDNGPSGNADGWVCRKEFTHGPNAGSGNIVDNSIPLHVSFP